MCTVFSPANDRNIYLYLDTPGNTGFYIGNENRRGKGLSHRKKSYIYTHCVILRPVAIPVAQSRTVKGEAGQTYETNEEELRAFVAHNLITDPAEARQYPDSRAGTGPWEERPPGSHQELQSIAIF